MDDGLTVAEVGAFAAIFRDRDSAHLVLDRAGFPASHVPFDASTPLLFWASVSQELRSGVQDDGREQLLAAARELYPYNPAFGGDVSATVLTADATATRPAAWTPPRRRVRTSGWEQAASEADRAPAERVADGLAVAVGTQWAAEARFRRLNDPAPLSVSWEPVNPSLMQPWRSLVRLATAGAGWPSVPGRPATRGWATGPKELAGSDGGLANILTRVPTHRLVVLGEPGSGKTMLLVRLLLDLLARRPAGGPVPVLLPLASWNPTRQRLDIWLANRLATDYPALAERADDDARKRTRAQMLLDTGMLVLLLDGLDEIPDAVRGQAISKINSALQAGQQLVLTCRTRAYRRASHPTRGAEVRLIGAAGIQLCPLAPEDVATYLRDAASGPSAEKNWAPIVAALTAKPASPVGRALATPLMAGLARAVYNPSPGEPDIAAGRSPSELLDSSLFPTVTSIEHHLFDAFITAAYRDHPDPERQPHWNAADAERWLTFLARHLQRDLDGQPDLAWWRLPDAVPRRAFTLGIATFVGLIAGLTIGIAEGIIHGVIGFLVAAPSGARMAETVRRRPIDRPTQTRLRPARFVGGLAGGFLPGAGILLLLDICTDTPLDPAATIAFGAAVGLIIALMLGFQPKPVELETAPGPGPTIAGDRTAFLSFALTYATIGGLAVGIALRLAFGPGPGLATGITIGIVGGTVGGILKTAWGRFTVARAYMLAHRQLPPNLMAFLADAHQNRGVLRQVGAVYQFRHLDLQRRLAER